jgi:hypothetical protein
MSNTEVPVMSLGSRSGGELDAGEPAFDAGGDGLGQQGLAHAGQVLQQDVSLGKQPQQGQPQVLGGGHHHLGHLVHQQVHLLLEGGGGAGLGPVPAVGWGSVLPLLGQGRPGWAGAVLL